MRRLNLVFLAALLVGGTLAGVGIHLVHGFQVRRNAWALLDRARRAESAQDLTKAEQSLRRYLNLRAEDGPVWAWYARVVDHRIVDRRRLDRDFLVHEEALRHDRDDAQLERRCAEIAMEMGRYNDARRHLVHLIEDPRLAGAELEDLLGQCESRLTRYEEAERRFVRAIERDPGRIACYDRLARLRRVEFRRIEAADATVEQMIARNRESGPAYIARWRYARDFAPPDDDRDIRKALELAPDDPEVLLTASVAAEERNDITSVRVYLEKGFRLDPRNPALALGLSRVETREGHPDRAEAILRRAFRANPVAPLAFELAENLVLQGKIDGKYGANEYLSHLRRAGLGNTFVPFLEAEILLRGKSWSEAARRFEMARAVLSPSHELAMRIDLMLAECHGHLGADEQRLDDLRRAVDGDRNAERTRVEFAQALARAGQVDRAVTVLLPVADRRPEWRVDLVRLMLRKAVRQPRDRRNWPEVERSLREAESTLPQSVESLSLLRVDVLAAQDRLDEARTHLALAQAKDPGNLRYRLATAWLAQRQDQGQVALQIIDQAEKELGPSPDIRLARLDYWGREGGDAARVAVAALAAIRHRIPAADRPALLDRLSLVETRLDALDLARQHGRELAALQPEDVGVRLRLFNLALTAGDQADAADLVAQIHKSEGEQGTSWRFARAALLIDKVRRGAPEHLDEARRLAADVSRRRPEWSGGFALEGEIAELAGLPDRSIACYLKAIELGNVRPVTVRRLAGLLAERNRFDEVERVAEVVRDQGSAVDEITLVKALDAIRKQDFDRGIALALRVFREDSKSYADHLNLGRIYLAAGRGDSAARSFHRAVELGPGVPEAWLAYVQYLVRIRRLDQARGVVAAARKALPTDRATSILARCALAVGDAAQAEELVARAINVEGGSEDPATLRLAAAIALGRNRPDKVDAYLNKLDRTPGASPDDRAWSNRTRIAMLLGTNRPADRDRALALIHQNLARVPESAEDQALKATILSLRPDRQGDAIAILESLAARDRLRDDPRFLLAKLYLGRRDEPKYQAEMSKLLGLKTRDPRHLAYFINHAIERNELDQAELRLAELKKDDPRGRLALELEARLLDVRKGRHELLSLLGNHGRQVPDDIGLVADLLNRYGFAREAEESYKAFMARGPGQPERSLALGRFLARQDRVPEALAIFKKAWSTCLPEEVAAAALFIYGAPSADDAQRRQVEAWVAEAVRRQPDSMPLATGLGDICLREGRYDEAEALYRRILSKAPDHVEAISNLAWVLALRGTGKGAESLELIDHAIALRGESASLAGARSLVLIGSGRSDQAEGALRDALERSPANPGLAFHLAWAFRTNGKADEARGQFRRAVELGLKPQALDPIQRGLFERLAKELSHE
jgi:tetratricopeptide (TPR) repeat protein